MVGKTRSSMLDGFRSCRHASSQVIEQMAEMTELKIYIFFKEKTKTLLNRIWGITRDGAFACAIRCENCWNVGCRKN